jgi:hypothetical protein
MPGTELRVAMKKKSKVLAFRREGVRSSIDSSMLQEFVVEKSVSRTSAPKRRNCGFLGKPLAYASNSRLARRGLIARNGVRAPVGVSVILQVAEHTGEGSVRFPGTRYERQCILSCLKSTPL